MLEEALARDATSEALEDTRVDAELVEMLTRMPTTIKVIGLGGGGSNTISRIAISRTMSREASTSLGETSTDSTKAEGPGRASRCPLLCSHCSGLCDRVRSAGWSLMAVFSFGKTGWKLPYASPPE